MSDKVGTHQTGAVGCIVWLGASFGFRTRPSRATLCLGRNLDPRFLSVGSSGWMLSERLVHMANYLARFRIDNVLMVPIPESIDNSGQ